MLSRSAAKLSTAASEIGGNVRTIAADMLDRDVCRETIRYFGQPGDLAEAIVFLMMNPYVTGHTLVVDGGLTVS